MHLVTKRLRQLILDLGLCEAVVVSGRKTGVCPALPTAWAPSTTLPWKYRASHEASELQPSNHS